VKIPSSLYAPIIIALTFTPSQALAQPDTSRASFSLGYKASMEGDWEGALNHLQSVPEDYILYDYSLYYLAETLFNLTRYDGAIEVYERLTPESLLAPLALTRIGDVYRTQGENLKAVDTYRRFLERYTNHKETPSVLYKLATTLLSLGREGEAIVAIKRLFVEYPLDRYTIEMEGLLKPPLTPEEGYKRIENLLKAKEYRSVIEESNDTAKEPRLLLLRGKASYYLREIKRAEGDLKKLLNGRVEKDLKGEALYYLARTYIRAKDIPSAVDTLQHLAGEDGYREEALYRLAILKREMGEITSSIEILKGLVREYPNGPFAPHALWQLAWGSYMKGDYREAQDYLKALEEKPPLKKRAIYWRGRVAMRLGDKETAITLFKRLCLDFPPTYYSVIAKGILEVLGVDVPEQPSFHDVSTIAIEPEAIGDIRIRKAEELLSIGLKDLAIKELEGVDNKNPNALFRTSLLFKEAGRISSSQRLARRLLDLPLTETIRGLPYPNIPYLAFPLGYQGSVEGVAREFNIDPYLIYAVITGESGFDERAVSIAGAIGLMQIMPKTGEEIARGLFYQPFERDNLFEPTLNIRFGAWYLRTLMDRFKGDIVLALAAYNAGPHVVEGWLKDKNGWERDEFVEDIPYNETRQYIERVMGNYEAYKTIYLSSY